MSGRRKQTCFFSFSFTYLSRKLSTVKMSLASLSLSLFPYRLSSPSLLLSRDASSNVSVYILLQYLPWYICSSFLRVPFLSLSVEKSNQHIFVWRFTYTSFLPFSLYLYLYSTPFYVFFNLCQRKSKDIVSTKSNIANTLTFLPTLTTYLVCII